MMLFLIRAALLSAGLLAVESAEAITGAGTSVPPALPDNGLWHMMGGLLIVLAIMAGAFWLLKQFTRGGMVGSGPMRTVGTIALGPKERVVLIECNGTWVMVGTAPGRVNSLHAMAAPAGGYTAAAPTAGQGPDLNVPPPFKRWLDKALQGKAK